MDWMYLVYFLLGGIIFFGAHRYRRGEWNEDFLSLRQTKAFEGIAALGIALHHMAQKTCAPWHPARYTVHGLDVFVPVGYLMVAIFLFYSGFGLYKSWKTRPDYLKHFLRRRVLAVVIAFWLSEVIYLVIRLAMGQQMDAKTVLWYLSGLHLANFNAWYIAVIPFFYLAFYAAFRFCKRDGAAITWVTGFTMLYVFICINIDHQDDWWFRGEWWYNSIILFPLGLLFGKYENKLVSAFKKRYWLYLPLSIAAFCALYHLSENILVPMWGYYGEYARDTLKELHRLGSAASQWLVCIAFVTVCLLFLMKVKLGNRILALLGAATLEFYLMHGVFVELFGFDFLEFTRSIIYIRNVPLYMAAVLACSVPATALFRFLWKGVMKLMDRFFDRPRIGKQERRLKKEKKAAGKQHKGRMKRMAGWIVPVSLAVLMIGITAGMELRRNDAIRIINGLRVEMPEGYVLSYTDSRYAVWKNKDASGQSGTLVLDTGIRNLNADYYSSAEDLLSGNDWLLDAELYINPQGIRMVRGYTRENTGSLMRRYYVESNSAMFLMSMTENEQYLDISACEELMLRVADAIRPEKS